MLVDATDHEQLAVLVAHHARHVARAAGRGRQLRPAPICAKGERCRRGGDWRPRAAHDAETGAAARVQPHEELTPGAAGGLAAQEPPPSMQHGVPPVDGVHWIESAARLAHTSKRDAVLGEVDQQLR